MLIAHTVFSFVRPLPSQSFGQKQQGFLRKFQESFHTGNSKIFLQAGERQTRENGQKLNCGYLGTSLQFAICSLPLRVFLYFIYVHLNAFLGQQGRVYLILSIRPRTLMTTLLPFSPNNPVLSHIHSLSSPHRFGPSQKTVFFLLLF